MNKHINYCLLLTIIISLISSFPFGCLETNQPVSIFLCFIQCSTLLSFETNYQLICDLPLYSLLKNVVHSEMNKH